MTSMTAVADYPARASGGGGVRSHLVLVHEAVNAYQPGVDAEALAIGGIDDTGAGRSADDDAGSRADAGTDTNAGTGVDADTGAEVGAGAGGLYGALQAVVADVVALDVAGPDDAQLRARRRVLQQVINQLSGSRARLSGELERRAMRAAGPGREQQALNHARRETGRDTRQSPSEVKQDGETGRGWQTAQTR